MNKPEFLATQPERAGHLKTAEQLRHKGAERIAKTTQEDKVASNSERRSYCDTLGSNRDAETPNGIIKRTDETLLPLQQMEIYNDGIINALCSSPPTKCQVTTEEPELKLNIDTRRKTYAASPELKFQLHSSTRAESLPQVVV